jgi:hypothetical protein
MLTKFCSLISPGCEQLYGTAPVIEKLLLIEYPRPWGHEALEESDIPAEVKLYLRRSLEAGDFSRIMLIKRQDSEAGRIRVFAVNCREEDPFIRAVVLGDYRELMELDLSRLFSERIDASADSLYLVCTNGKVDKCCSKFGLPVYYRLGQLGLPVWQSTHVTGDRFAPNIVQLPYGHYYGWAKVEQLEEFLHAVGKGQIYAPWYRGRCFYTQEVQAAEFFLRKALDEFGYDGLEILSAEIEGELLQVRASLRGLHTVRLTVKWSTDDYMLNCEPKMGKIKLFHLIGIV